MKPTRLSSSLSLLLSLGVLLALVFFIAYPSYRQNDNHLVYPLDDTYIHMSMAKNFAQKGVWGVTPHAFSSTSSSPLYTALLAFCYLVFGLSEYMPFLLNLIFGIGLVYALWRIAQREGVNPLHSFLLIVAAIVFVPLPQLIISGMEHTLQALIDLLLLYHGLRLALANERPTRKDYAVLALLTALAVTIRFEGLFLVAVLGLFLLLRKRFGALVVMGVAAVVPVVVYGAVSVSKGAFFFPNSVLLKGEQLHFTPGALFLLATNWLTRLYESPHLLVLFFVSGIYFFYTRFRQQPFWTMASVWTSGLLLLYILHLTFARVGWFERYEAYLVLLSFAGAFLALGNRSVAPFRWQRWLAYVSFVVVGLVVLQPLFLRFQRSYKLAPHAMSNVYNQQYQMARFLHRYYNDSTIAANDIGAITYFTNIRLFDMVGLASNEPLLLKRKNAYTKEAVTQLALDKKVQTVVIFENWYKAILPDGWQKAGTWTEPLSCWTGDSVTVSFYATPLHNPEVLKRNLREFSGQLPKHVVQGGAYLAGTDSSNASVAW